MEDKELEISVGQFMIDSYCNYGKYVNESRAIPSIMDGLKPSYRRLIYTSIKNGGKKMKSNTLVGETMVLHAHGNKSIEDVITQLANRGLFDPLGNFGFNAMYGESMGAASPRYTHTRLTKSWYDALAPLIDFVPFKTSDADSQYQEPEYLPTPIPISLCIGTFGIGIGISTEIPAFSPKSIIDCYLNDDPSLLRPAFDIELDEENSDLHSLWNKGYGNVNWKYKVTKSYSDDGTDGVYIEGNTFMFTPDWTTFEEWRSHGWIFIRDESTGEKGRVFIGRNKGVRSINQDQIYDEAVRCASSVNVTSPHKQVMRPAVYDGELARYISLKEWVDNTYTNYVGLINKYKSHNLDRLAFNKKVYTHLKDVAKLIFEDPAIEEDTIISKLGIELEVVKAILRKTIKTLMKADTDYELSKIQDDISYYESINPDDYIKNLINNL